LGTPEPEASVTDEQGLLAAIWADPHDDTPRLVYADWLQERDQPDRAEFVRTQIELATLDEWDDSPRKAELQGREKELRAKHAMAWKADLPAAFRQRAGFHRGFPNPQPRNLPSSKFLKLTAADFAGAPLWTFRLPPNVKALPQVLAVPEVLRIGSLDLQLWVESEGDVEHIVAAPTVRNVAALHLGASRFDDAAAAVLAGGAAALPHLWSLNLGFSRVTHAGLKALATSPLADRLESLSLSHASTDDRGIGRAGVEALAESPRLGRLKRLDLSHFVTGRFKAGDPGRAVRRLFESRHLTGLRSLQLYHSGLGDADLSTVCESRPRVRLAELSLMSQYPKIADAGAEALAAWPGLASVRRLSVAFNEIGRAGMSALIRSPHLGELTELDVRGNPAVSSKTTKAALSTRFGKALRA
jgi:uncharacterized protein (TIGR02996 family)